MASVTVGEPSFLTMRIFLGGRGHCRHKRSWFDVSVVYFVSEALLGVVSGMHDMYLGTTGRCDSGGVRHHESLVVGRRKRSILLGF